MALELAWLLASGYHLVFFPFKSVRSYTLFGTTYPFFFLISLVAMMLVGATCSQKDGGTKNMIEALFLEGFQRTRRVSMIGWHSYVVSSLHGFSGHSRGFLMGTGYGGLEPGLMFYRPFWQL